MNGDLESEAWLPVVGCEGDYEVSNMGRIRRARAMCHGALPAHGLLKCTPNKYGYPLFTGAAGGRSFRAPVHLVVLAAFVGPRPPGKQTAHLNGVRNDPRLSKLIYATPKENNAHKAEHGTLIVGSAVAASKLTEEQVLDIRNSYESASALAARYGIHDTHVRDVRRGKSWAHLKAGRSLTADRNPPGMRGCQMTARQVETLRLLEAMRTKHPCSAINWNPISFQGERHANTALRLVEQGLVTTERTADGRLRFMITDAGKRAATTTTKGEGDGGEHG